MTELDKIWKSMTDIIQTEIQAYRFDVWIKTLEPLCIHDGRLVVQAPTAANKAVVVQNFMPALKEALKEVHPSLTEVAVIVQEELEDYLGKSGGKGAPTEAKSAAGTGTGKDEAGKGGKKPPAYELAYNASNMFNPEYTFDDFIVGKGNQFVHAAAESVARESGTRYNPLFIYGGVGLGKTHIVHAVGNYLRDKRPELKVLYVTCENFVNELIEAIRAGDTREFRAKYRKLDVLMIDDIQEIANKTRTQEEIFHTFNDLHSANKQIIITSDKPPRDITPLEERLRTRFEWGMTADMQPPDLETRIAILQKKSERKRYNVKDEVLAFLAAQVENNIREMEGLLNRVVCYASLVGKTVTLDLAKEAVKDYVNKNAETLTAEAIIDTVCKYYSVTREDIIGKKKNKEIVLPRMLCIYLITEMLSLPLTKIGQIFGNRDHTTVIHSRDKIAAEIKSDNKIKVIVQDMRNLIYHK
ncbi:chromosomal replication initiator protein DnaA [Clostridia bacterium]|nr:chromosomal replication initiator protein DnaA [Clostridia bacterium]